MEYSDWNSCLLSKDTILAEITQEERLEVGEDALKKELENSGINVTACNDGTCILPGRMAGQCLQRKWECLKINEKVH